MTHSSRRDLRQPGLLRRLLQRIDSGLFAAEDARARDRGWQVETLRGGRGRRYRDPRWDSVRLCELCEGRDGACPLCDGGGVIRDDSPAPRHEAAREPAHADSATPEVLS